MARGVDGVEDGGFDGGDEAEDDAHAGREAQGLGNGGGCPILAAARVGDGISGSGWTRRDRVCPPPFLRRMRHPSGAIGTADWDVGRYGGRVMRWRMDSGVRGWSVGAAGGRWGVDR